MNYRIRKILGIILLIASIFLIGYTLKNIVEFENNKTSMKAMIKDIKSTKNNYLAIIKYKVNDKIYEKNIMLDNKTEYKKDNYVNVFYNQNNPEQFECPLNKKIYLNEILLILGLILFSISIILLLIIPKYSEYEFSSTVNKKDIKISSLLAGVSIIGTIVLYYLNNKELIVSKSLIICKWYLLAMGILLLLFIISSSLTSKKLNGSIRWR